MTDESVIDWVDFDAAWLEHRARPWTLTVPSAAGSEFGGDRVRMPASMPAGAKLHLFRVRAERGEDHDLTLAEMQVTAALLFGEHRVNDWIQQRIPDEVLEDAVSDALAEYAARQPASQRPGGDEGKAPSPSSGGPGTSSTTGPTSKPTSPASTASTLPATSGP